MFRVLPVIFSAAVLAGCGGGATTPRATTPTPAPSRPALTSSERLRLAEYEFDFSSTALNGGHLDGTDDGVEFLIHLCRAKASAVYDDTRHKRTVMQVAEDASNTLREYQSALAAKLDRVLDDRCA